MIQIAPSILSADFARLGDDIQSVESAGADLLHVDVMDGRFVPNITIGPPVVSAIRRVTQLPLDCHLMIVEPERYIGEFARAGASMISVHVEVSQHLNRTLAAIHELGCRAGVAINPGTTLSMLEDVLADADYILVMSVNPGFGGQKFMESSVGRIRRLREMIRARGLGARIEVDGGIAESTTPLVVEAGAEMLVAGSAIFHAEDRAAAVKKIQRAAQVSQLV